MKQFWKSFKKWVNRHTEEFIVPFLVIDILIGGIIGGFIGSNFYQPVGQTKIELFESIANDVWKQLQEVINGFSDISINLSSVELSEMVEVNSNVLENLSVSVEKSTVKILEKDVTVIVDFSNESTYVQEKSSKLNCSLIGAIIGAIGFLLSALIMLRGMKILK